MFNSGLIGMSPAHVPLLEDTLAIIDALIGRARKFPTLEQFALSEVVRLNQIPSPKCATVPALLAGAAAHLYGEPDRKDAVAGLGRPDAAEGNGRKMNYWAVRAYNYWYGVTHALEMLRR